MKNKMKGFIDSGEVYVDGKFINPKYSLDVINHSPTGFSWGYGGSGPAQLALAILLEFSDKEVAADLHQIFKEKIIARLPRRNFELKLDVSGWIRVYQEIEKRKRKKERQAFGVAAAEEKLKHLDWRDHLIAILRDFKEGSSIEKLNGAEMDGLVELIKAKLNLIERNISFDEYYRLELKIVRANKGRIRNLIELTQIQRKMVDRKCPACKKGELYPVDGLGDVGENYLRCGQCFCSVDSEGDYVG